MAIEEIPDSWDNWIKELCKKKIILDLGGGTPFQGSIKPDMIEKDTKYFCMDYCSEYKPHIIADIQFLPFKDNSVDGILVGSVLQLVPQPWLAIKETLRILKKDGLLLTYVPFMFPYGGCKYYKDYYRFSIDGVYFLFKDFSNIKILKGGSYFVVVLRFMAGFSSAQKYLLKFEKIIRYMTKIMLKKSMKRYRQNYENLSETTTGYNIYAKK